MSVASRAGEARAPGAGEAGPPGAGNGWPPVASDARRPGLGPWIAAITALAVILRVWHLRHGLPEFLEEAIPFRQALGMWGFAGRPDDWNPHLFHYPSLTIYIQFVLQKLHYAIGHLRGVYASPADFLLEVRTNPTPMVTLGRLAGVVADAFAVVSVAKIGERLARGAGPLAALMVACAPALIVAGRSIFSDTVMTALALGALERMLSWYVKGGRGRLVAAVVLIGLAAGAKYPAAAMLLPLGAVLVARLGWRAAWPIAIAALSAFVVFLATTPYALLDFPAFARDFGFVGGLASGGHLGDLDRPGFAFHLTNLGRNVGWIGVALAACSLFLVAARMRRRAPDAPAWLALWLALMVFGAPIAVARIEVERYLIPVVPLAALLAAATGFALARRAAPRFRFAAVTLMVAALAVPALVRGVDAGRGGARSTQIEAGRWVETHLGRDQVMVQEAYGVATLTRQERIETEAGELFAAASPAARARYQARPWAHVVHLPLTVAGRCIAQLRSPAGTLVELEIYPHVVDLNQMLYDPRLFAGVDYVLTTSAVRGRFEADPVRFAAQRRFYALLDSAATLELRVRAERGMVGPEIAIYRLGDRARAAIEALGPLDPLWWAERIPDRYRVAADSVLATRAPWGGPPRDASGVLAPWVMSLAPMYADRLATLTGPLAVSLADVGRWSAARRLAAATLAVAPADLEAVLVYSTAAGRLGEWRDARAAVERALAIVAAEGEPPAILRLEHAEVLVALGEREGARAELVAVAASGGDLAAEARRRLETLR